MATVDELARDLVGSLSLDEGFLIAARWIDNRYKQLVSRVRFRHLRKVGEVQIPATYDTGTLSVTRDTTSVTGASTAWQTNIGSGTQEYWYLKPSSAWYKIASVGSETAITLTTNFSEDTVSAGSYSAVKRHHALDSNSRWLGDFVLSRLRLTLDTVALEEIDREAPGRILTSQFPRKVCQIGVDSSNDLMVEFYPYSAKSEIVHYVYWDLPTELTISSTIPTQVDPYVLKEGALVDAYRYLKSKARQKGSHEAANSWRNDEFAQRTTWESILRESAQADKGIDDAAFILSMFGGRRTVGDITNAHDHVYSNWSYPS